jgi:hypothetical protein
MKLTWHIVLKDLRRLRIPISVWMLSYVAQFLVGARLLSGSVTMASGFQSTMEACGGLNLIQFVVGFLLIPELIFEDALVDASAFWPTRPISGGRLLGAKLVACAILFGLLPILVSLPWWLSCGFGGGEMLHAALHSLGYQFLLVSLGLLIASVTATYPRFIGYTLALAVGVGLAFLTLVNPVVKHLFFHGLDQVTDSGVNAARLHLVIVIALCASAGIVANQFLTRRLARSLWTLACVLGLLAVEVTWWPLDPGVHPRAPVSPSLPDLDSVVAIVPQGDWRLNAEGGPMDTSDAYVYGSFDVERATPEMLLHFDSPILEWRWPDGRVSRSEGRILQPAWRQQGSEYQLESVIPHKVASESDWERTPGYQNMLKRGVPKTWEEIYKASPANHAWDFYAEVPRADGLRMLTQPSSFTLEIRGEYLRPKLAAEVALQKGASWSSGSQGFRIAKAEWNRQQNWLDVLLVEHRPSIGSVPFNPFPFSYSNDLNGAYVAINRGEGESSRSFGGSNNALEVHIAGVAIQLRNLSFLGPSNRTLGEPVWDKGGVRKGPFYEDWFTHVSLARVTVEPEGSFLRRISTDGFTLTLDTFSKAP